MTPLCCADGRKQVEENGENKSGLPYGFLCSLDLTDILHYRVQGAYVVDCIFTIPPRHEKMSRSYSSHSTVAAA